MHPTIEEFVADAEARYGVDLDVREFEEGTKTAADAAAAIGCEVAQIASSLVFIADGDPVVVVTSGANRVSEARLADLLDAEEVRMAEPDEVRAVTGWGIGGVPPFCHDERLPVYCDETLTGFEEVWAAAGTPTGVFRIASDRLVDLADATVARVAE